MTKAAQTRRPEDFLELVERARRGRLKLYVGFAAGVDEIPHTNAPGSRNRKRYQDVLALLDAGINVIGAINVQHLESLNGLIERATGVVVRETVPDSFLTQADQVVNLDLAVEDLQ